DPEEVRHAEYQSHVAGETHVLAGGSLTRRGDADHRRQIDGAGRRASPARSVVPGLRLTWLPRDQCRGWRPSEQEDPRPACTALQDSGDSPFSTEAQGAQGCCRAAMT